MACQAPALSARVGMQSTRSEILDGVSMQDSALAMNSFVAEMQFVFPQQSAEISRSLLRTAMAQREAQRLGIQLPKLAVESAITTLETSVLQSLGAEGDLDSWAYAQHQQSWAAVRPQYARHLADNLLYQTVLRADAIQHGRVKMWWLLSSTSSQATQWARSLASGRDPASLLSESLVSGPEPDGSYPPLAVYLPGAAGVQVATATAGDLIGPLQLPGDQSWMVGLVIAVLPAQEQLPPVSVLLEDLRQHPVGPLEARAWFDEMSRRYTAHAIFSPITAPLEAFVPIR
jgi:hypothetical protein